MELVHNFKIGDEVYHVSNPKLKMAVENVDDLIIECSYYNPKSQNIEVGKFSYTSLRKFDKGPRMIKRSIIV